MVVVERALWSGDGSRQAHVRNGPGIRARVGGNRLRGPLAGGQRGSRVAAQRRLGDDAPLSRCALRDRWHLPAGSRREARARSRQHGSARGGRLRPARLRAARAALRQAGRGPSSALRVRRLLRNGARPDARFREHRRHERADPPHEGPAPPPAWGRRLARRHDPRPFRHAHCAPAAVWAACEGDAPARGADQRRQAPRPSRPAAALATAQFALLPNGLAVGVVESYGRDDALVPYRALRPYLSRLGLRLVAGARWPDYRADRGHFSYCRRPGPSWSELSATGDVPCATAREAEREVFSQRCYRSNRCVAAGFTCLAFWDGRYDRPFDYTHHAICHDGRRRIVMDEG